MSENKLTIDKIAQNIDSLFFCEKLEKRTLADYFYDHLTSLLKYYLATIENDEDSQLKIGKKTYSELEQFTLENSKVIEYNEDGEIDWDLIDDAKDILKAKLVEAFGKETGSEHLRLFVRSVSDSYENWLIYNLMHPESVFNPWTSLLNILKQGCLYLISDNKDILTEYVRDIYLKADKQIHDNIGFVTVSRKEKQFSGFLSDSRYNSQISVYQFLRQNAEGSQNAKSMEIIREFLSEYEDRHVGKREFRSKVVYPLKQTGLIGSSPEGFFHITTFKDMQGALSNQSSQKILEIYKRRSQLLGVEESISELIEKNIPYTFSYARPYQSGKEVSVKFPSSDSVYLYPLNVKENWQSCSINYQ